MPKSMVWSYNYVRLYYQKMFLNVSFKTRTYLKDSTSIKCFYSYKFQNFEANLNMQNLHLHIYRFTYYSFRKLKHFVCNATYNNCKILTIPVVRPHYLFKCFVNDKPKYYFSNTKIRLLQKNTRFVAGPMYGQ